jgi:hypothetical protein
MWSLCAQGGYVQSVTPVFGQQPIPFGSMPPTMQPASTYYQPVPAAAAPFVPGPSQHTLHPNAPQFVRFRSPMPQSVFPPLRQSSHHQAHYYQGKTMCLCCQCSPVFWGLGFRVIIVGKRYRAHSLSSAHASAAAQIPSQGYGHPPGGSPPPPSRVYTGQPLGVLGAPSELPSYTPAAVPHPGAWQHDSPPSTPKLQVTEPLRCCLVGTLLFTARYYNQVLPASGWQWEVLLLG